MTDLSTSKFCLRPYDACYENDAFKLWEATWKEIYPLFDFAAHRSWFTELMTTANVTVASRDGRLIGFVTVDLRNFYLDQLLVAPEYRGSGVGGALIAAAKGVALSELNLTVNSDSTETIKFYEARGFYICGDGINPIDNEPTYSMRWRSVT